MSKDTELLSDKLARAAQEVEVGARYMHYKQRTYKVVGLALREEDLEPCVIYQAEYAPGLTWIRPVSMWFDDIEFEGSKVKRFTKL